MLQYIKKYAHALSLSALRTRLRAKRPVSNAAPKHQHSAANFLAKLNNLCKAGSLCQRGTTRIGGTSTRYRTHRPLDRESCWQRRTIEAASGLADAVDVAAGSTARSMPSWPAAKGPSWHHGGQRPAWASMSTRQGALQQVPCALVPCVEHSAMSWAVSDTHIYRKWSSNKFPRRSEPAARNRRNASAA